MTNNKGVFIKVGNVGQYCRKQYRKADIKNANRSFRQQCRINLQRLCINFDANNADFLIPRIKVDYFNHD